MAQIGTHQKGSANVELNIVPFIDLMSCMTAFLLVTAVWISQASMPTAPATHGAGSAEEKPRVAILIEYDQIVVTATPSGEVTQLASNDWGKLETTLAGMKPAGEVPPVEVAAASSTEHPVAYQALITAMDTAVKAGYPDVGVIDPRSLR